MIPALNRRGVSYGADTADPDPQGRVRLIQRRAYQKWQAKGCPSGTALQDWLEAEAEVDAALQSERWSNLCKTWMPAEIVPH
jgi:hypothetical protein